MRSGKKGRKHYKKADRHLSGGLRKKGTLRPLAQDRYKTTAGGRGGGGRQDAVAKRELNNIDLCFTAKREE